MDALINEETTRIIRAIVFYGLLALALGVLWKLMVYFREQLGPGQKPATPEELMAEFEAARDEGELDEEEFRRIETIIRQGGNPYEIGRPQSSDLQRDADGERTI